MSNVLAILVGKAMLSLAYGHDSGQEKNLLLLGLVYWLMVQDDMILAGARS